MRGGALAVKPHTPLLWRERRKAESSYLPLRMHTYYYPKWDDDDDDYYSTSTSSQRKIRQAERKKEEEEWIDDNIPAEQTQKIKQVHYYSSSSSSHNHTFFPPVKTEPYVCTTTYDNDDFALLWLWCWRRCCFNFLWKKIVYCRDDTKRSSFNKELATNQSFY